MTVRLGAPKTGGRKRGSLDKAERAIVTAEMAGDILTVYKRLGGVKWFLAWAQKNESEFVRQALSKLLPAAPKDDADFVQNNQFNVGDLSALEAGRRVAFALNLGLHIQEEMQHPVIEIAPEAYQEMPRWRPPTDAPDMLPPEPAHETPVEDPDRAEWAASLPMTPEERRDQLLVQETKTATLENYHGSSAEQGGAPVQRSVSRKPTAAELCRRMSRRSELL